MNYWKHVMFSDESYLAPVKCGKIKVWVLGDTDMLSPDLTDP
jgi:hypothetical protein